MNPEEDIMLDCDRCGDEVTTDDIQCTDGGDNLCQDCYEEHIVMCCDCGEEVIKDEARRGDGDWYCDDCFGEHFFTCSHCGDIYNTNDSHETPDGNLMCEDCYCDRCCQCESCSETMWSDDSMICPDGYPYCDYCFNERYGSCRGCGETHYLEDLCYDEEQDGSFCEGCHNSSSRLINRWNYRPRVYQMYKLAFENTLFMGTELEIQSRGDWSDKVELIQNKIDKDCPGVFYFKEDGSVSNGFEIVSHPFTLQYAHKHIPFRELLKYVKARGFTSYENGNCGIHVHLSRSFFTDNEVRKLRMFFDAAHDYIHTFSARGDNTSYCRRYNYDVNSYKSRNDYQEGRYYSLNCNTGKPTVEIRVFRGTLKYSRFLASLQFSDAVAHFVKSVSFMALRDPLSWGLFCRWIIRQNRYHHLIKELKRRRIFFKEGLYKS